MEREISCICPFGGNPARALRAGDTVRITGSLYTARDAAHRRMLAARDAGERLPFELGGQFLYYTGPAPAKPGQICGPAGPTTSGRMDAYTPRLLDLGLRGMIGKGRRSPEVVESIVKNGAVYFGAVGGAAALIAKSVKKCEVVCYEDLGTEAVHRFEVENFPAIVLIDARGENLYEREHPKYRR
jgi:fumarate hydratase subunit beta